MNQKIVDYLQQNKDQYSQKLLVEQLHDSGYIAEEVSEAVKLVYNSIPSNVAPPALAIKNGSSIRVKLVLIFLVVSVMLIVAGIIFYRINNDKTGNEGLEFDNMNDSMMYDRDEEDLQNDKIKRLYINEKFGFSILFPVSWAGYSVADEKIYGPERGVRFGFSQQDNLFSVYVYTKQEWKQVKEDYQSGNIPGDLPTMLGESSEYVYAYPFAYEIMSELERQSEDISSVVSSFKLIK